MNSLPEVKNRILARSPLEKVIGESIEVQKRAGRLVACCPFHNEKTPSFYIYDDHYHCFGCGSHGDAISFVQHQQGLSFMESLRWLARKFAIEAPELEQTAGHIKQWQQAARHSQILLAAQEFYASHLNADGGNEAQQYLSSRGFTPAAITAFGFGYAPDEPAPLLNHLRRHSYKPEELETASLVSLYQGKAYDFFRHRLIIPIRDTHGRLIAFGGRAMGQQQQKYKNSRYDKGSVLFALDLARKAMRQKCRGIVVEGYLDAIQLHQHGFPETVACQGTALTREHMRSLRSATPMVYLLFDGDQAGHNASLKAVKESLNFPEVQFKVALLPEGEDPDSYVRKHGREGIEAILTTAEDLLTFAVQSKLQATHGTAIPSLVTQEFVPWLASIDDAIKRSFLCQKIAELTGIPAATVQHAVGLHGRPGAPSPIEPPVTALPPQEDEDALSAFAREPGPLAPLLYEFIGHLYYANPGELDLAGLNTFIANELQTDAAWLYFISEIIAYLAADKAPWQQDASGWVACQANAVMQLLARLKDNAPAFAGQVRKNCLTRLQLITRQNNIRNTITSLKEQLTKDQLSPGSIGQQIGGDEWRQTLGEITKLSQRLYQIEREIRQI